jgi:uncharacterized protein YfkK (UPF0435 family)
MRSREYLFKKIEHLENKLKILSSMVRNGSSKDNFNKELEYSEEILSEIKSAVEREPFTPNEINRI